jgi:hypothetical protein
MESRKTVSDRDKAAQQLSTQQRVGVRNLNVRSSWQNALSGLADISATQQSNQGGRNLNAKASWQKALTQMGDIGADIQSTQKAKGSNVRASWQKALTQMGDIGADLERASRQRFREKSLAEEKRQRDLGIGVNTPTRIGGPVRRTGAIPMSGGTDSGIMPRALPSQKALEQRIALSGQRQPARLDKLKEDQEKAASERRKQADKELEQSGQRLAKARD